MVSLLPDADGRQASPGRPTLGWSCLGLGSGHRSHIHAHTLSVIGKELAFLFKREKRTSPIASFFSKGFYVYRLFICVRDSSAWEEEALRLSLSCPCFQEKNISLLPSAQRQSQRPWCRCLSTEASCPFGLDLCLLGPPFQVPSQGAAKHRPLPREPLQAPAVTWQQWQSC